MISEDAENLLGRIVALGQWDPDGWVSDEALCNAAHLSYNEEYLPAAEELVKVGLAESRPHTTDLSFLRATPEGRERVQSL